VRRGIVVADMSKAFRTLLVEGGELKRIQDHAMTLAHENAELKTRLEALERIIRNQKSN